MSKNKSLNVRFVTKELGGAGGRVMEVSGGKDESDCLRKKC